MIITELASKLESFSSQLAALRKENEALKTKIAELTIKLNPAEVATKADIRELENKMASAGVLAARKLASLGVRYDQAPGAGDVAGSPKEQARQQLREEADALRAKIFKR